MRLAKLRLCARLSRYVLTKSLNYTRTHTATTLYPTDNALLTRCRLNSFVQVFFSLFCYASFSQFQLYSPHLLSHSSYTHTRIKSSVCAPCVCITIEKYVIGLAEDTSTMRINVWVSDRNNPVEIVYDSISIRSVCVLLCDVWCGAVHKCVLNGSETECERSTMKRRSVWVWYVYKLYRWARPTWFVSMSASLRRVSAEIFRCCVFKCTCTQYSCATHTHTRTPLVYTLPSVFATNTLTHHTHTHTRCTHTQISSVRASYECMGCKQIRYDECALQFFFSRTHTHQSTEAHTQRKANEREKKTQK